MFCSSLARLRLDAAFALDVSSDLRVIDGSAWLGNLEAATSNDRQHTFLGMLIGSSKRSHVLVKAHSDGTVGKQ
jgi:hypothetical protein